MRAVVQILVLLGIWGVLTGVFLLVMGVGK